VIISELSARSGVSPRLLRYYEEQGLVTASRAANGYRQYDESAVINARIVRTMFQMGFSQDKVRAVLACAGDRAVEADHVAARASVAEMRDDIDQQMQRLASTRELLTEFLERE
jgi:DNA-binding transcriptional MerR regulator